MGKGTPASPPFPQRLWVTAEMTHHALQPMACEMILYHYLFSSWENSYVCFRKALTSLTN